MNRRAGFSLGAIFTATLVWFGPAIAQGLDSGICSPPECIAIDLLANTAVLASTRLPSSIKQKYRKPSHEGIDTNVSGIPSSNRSAPPHVVQSHVYRWRLTLNINYSPLSLAILSAALPTFTLGAAGDIAAGSGTGAAADSHPGRAPIVTVDGGLVRGLSVSGGYVFRGLPWAARQRYSGTGRGSEAQQGNGRNICQVPFWSLVRRAASAL